MNAKQPRREWPSHCETETREVVVTAALPHEGFHFVTEIPTWQECTHPLRMKEVVKSRNSTSRCRLCSAKTLTRFPRVPRSHRE